MIIRRIIALLLCLMTVSGSQLPIKNDRPLSDHYIEKLGMTIALPTGAYVTGRTVSADYEPLELFGMTASQLEVELKKGNIYCTALWFPEENDMTEIVVTMTEDDDSRAIFQLRDYDDFYLGSLADSYANYSEHGLNVNAMYTDAEVVRNDQAALIKAHGVMFSEDAAENHLHYMTVVNGQRVEITLVEHFTVEEGVERPVTVSAANERMMDEIISRLAFDSLDNEFVAKNGSFVFGAVVVCVLSAAMIIAYFVSKYRAARLTAAARHTGVQPSEEKPEPEKEAPENPEEK